MQFSIIYTRSTEERQLRYVTEDYAFDMEPMCNFVDFEVCINKVCLTTLMDEGDGIVKVIELSGFCPYGNWQDTNYTVPKYQRGRLAVLSKMNYGLSYGLNEEAWPEYVNLNTGWVCIGDPTRTGQAVEFIRNCVAVLEGDKLVALWLKPEHLPVKEIEEFRKEQAIA